MIHYDQFEKPTLRVVVLCPCLGVGGAERWLATIMRYSNALRFTAVVAAARMASELSPEFPSVPVFYCDAGDRNEAIRRGLARGADVILTWGFGDLGPAREYGVPIIHVSHSSGDEPPNDWQHALFRLNASQTQAHFLAAVSESSAGLFSPEVRRAEPVHVVHNGSELERVAHRYGREWQRNQWGIGPKQKVALYVGRFSKEKNPAAMVQAAAILPDGWAVVLYGWGEMAESLRQMANSAGSANQIVFPKPRAGGLGDVYAAADVVVLPSYTEAFPLVMVESWQARRPFICSRFRTIDELETRYAGGESLALTGAPPLDGHRIAVLAQMAVSDDVEPMVDRAYRIATTELTASRMAARWDKFVLDCVSDWHLNALRGRVWQSGTTEPWHDQKNAGG